MPILEIQSSAPPITDSDLDRVEAELGAKLPTPYRDFLRAHNGGRPTPSAFLFGDEPGSLLQSFFAVDHPDPLRDILRNYRGSSRMIPGDLMPIGIDAGGSLVLLGIRGARHGKVFFWSLEDAPEPPDPTSYENVWVIADSFDAFIEGFYEETPD